MAQIFLSYSHQDQGVAERLAAQLEEEGYDVWWDRNIVPAGDMDDIVRRELDSAKIVIVIWSESSVRSDWVRGEAITAQEADKLIAVTYGDDAQQMVPIRFRFTSSCDVSNFESIVKALTAKGHRAAHFSPELRAFLEESAQHPPYDYTFGYHAREHVDWRDPGHFASLVVETLVRYFQFPVSQEITYLTDGIGDAGIDGFALAWGNTAVTEESDFEAIIACAPRASVRLLFIQAKRSTFVAARDVSHFGASVQQFLLTSADDFFRSYINDEMSRARTSYDSLIDAARKSGINPRLEVDIVFAYAAVFEGYPGPTNALENSFNGLRALLPNATVNFSIFGTNELLEAFNKVRPSSQVELTDVELVKLPGSKARSYGGYINAKTYIDALIHENDRGGRELDPSYFAINPRGYLGLKNEKFNRGAAGLRKTIKDGLGEEVVLGHNGVVIFARAFEQPSENSIRLVTPQVVNGCQSTNVLFECYDQLADVYLPIKIVVSDDDNVINRATRAANTQQQVGDWDMISRLPNLIALKRKMESDHRRSRARVCLKLRRGREYINLAPFDANRVVSPRQLAEAYVAVVDMQPHNADANSYLRQIETGEIFADGHDANMYRMLAWLVACGRKSCQQLFDVKRWDGALNSVLDDSHQAGFAARRQFYLVLFRLIDPIGAISNDERKSSPGAQSRFERHVHALSEIYDGVKGGVLAPELRNAGHVLADAAGGYHNIRSTTVNRALFTDTLFERTATVNRSGG